MRFFRRHPAFAVLLLVAHVVAPIGWAQGAVLCIGADGHVAIESAHAKPACGDSCAGGEAAETTESVGGSDGRCCVDVSAPSCEPVKGREDVTAKGGVDAGEVMAGVDDFALAAVVTSAAPIAVRTGPPPGLAFVRIVVLRL